MRYVSLPENTARGGKDKRVRHVSSPLSEANLGEVDRPKAETEEGKPSTVNRQDPPPRLHRYSPQRSAGGRDKIDRLGGL